MRLCQLAGLLAATQCVLISGALVPVLVAPSSAVVGAAAFGATALGAAALGLGAIAVGAKAGKRASRRLKGNRRGRSVHEHSTRTIIDLINLAETSDDSGCVHKLVCSLRSAGPASEDELAIIELLTEYQQLGSGRFEAALVDGSSGLQTVCVSSYPRCPHSSQHMMQFVKDILNMPDQIIRA